MPKKNLIYFLGFIFSISLISTPHFSYGDNTVTVESFTVESFPVDYTIENGIVDTIFLDPDFISLIVTMDINSDGIIEITIPRLLLDAKFDTLDDEFFVLVDGFETDYAEINSTSEYRTLVIPFFGGDSVVDIIGTDALNPFFPETKIPSWIKNNAGWWADGSIGDSDFVLGIQFLIKEGIVKVHQTTQTKQPSYQPQSLFD